MRDGDKKKEAVKLDEREMLRERERDDKMKLNRVVVCENEPDENMIK